MKCRRCSAELKTVNGIRVDAEPVHAKPIYGYTPLLGDPYAVTIHIEGKRSVFGCRTTPDTRGAIEGHTQHYCAPPERVTGK